MLTQLGPYEIIARIGKGAMAETFLAERTEAAGTKVRVCIKRLLDEDQSDPKWIKMFQHEAQLVSSLFHPNVVRLHAFDHHQGIWWMALELVPGIDLRVLQTELRASRTRLPVDVVVKIGTEIAYGLAHAHECRLGDDESGIVHRDVSPSNILVSHHGEVKLTDFGIARVQKKAEKTRSGTIKGKEAYLSPEQAMDHQVDGRTDLFALGVVMFELLAGVGPYKGLTNLATLINANNGTRTKHLREEAPDVPHALAAIVDSLVESNRDNRIATASELVRQLDELGVWQVATRRLASIVSTARPRLDAAAEEQLTKIELTAVTGGGDPDRQ